MTKINFNEKQYRLAETFKEALDGSKPAKDKFFEALTTSDLPTALEPTLNVAVLEEYEGIPTQWEAYADRRVVDDFRLQEIAKYGFEDGGIPAVNGGETYVPGTLPLIPEGGEYPVITVTGSSVQFRLAKGGARFELSWERIINDRSLSEIERAWRRLARMARNTEEKEASRQFVNASGLNTTNLTDGSGGTNDNLLASNPVLSATSLEAAWVQATQHTIDGHRFVMPQTLNLIIPSALEFQARKILNETQYNTNPASGTVEYQGPNPLNGKFNIVVNDWFATLDSTNGDTTWGIAPQPGAIEDGGAFNAFLRGHEAPRFMVKQTAVIDPDDVQFDDDTFATKVRHPLAGGFGSENAGIVFSNGTGS